MWNSSLQENVFFESPTVTHNGFIGVPIAFYPHPLTHKLASHTYNLTVSTVTYHNVNSAWKSDNKTNL